ncbi:hypothetical protein OAO87_02655 [bacterium]|nr:hypothetical protein [bacterium]
MSCISVLSTISSRAHDFNQACIVQFQAAPTCRLPAISSSAHGV